MNNLKPHPKIKLSRLRDIGWSLWDPIGLLAPGQSWSHADHQSFADEYDSYLLCAAGQLMAGTPEQDVVKYLVSIEADYMGLGEREGSQGRAERVVEAMKADDELWVLASPK